ncbi:TPA: hypothetical protein ACH3X1_010591 [Trebouxia sp. C0004]
MMVPSVLLAPGATPVYAAPELLRSLQLQFEDFDLAEPGLWTNGPSADWWAVGIVLFELLTGEVPFCGKAATKASENIDSLCKEEWEDHEGVLQAHQSWMQACELAFQTGREFEAASARFLCCGGSSPTLKADSRVGHGRSAAKDETNSSKWWKVLQPAKRRQQRSRDVAAYTDASVHSQNGAVQADSFHTAFQGVIFGESRQADQQVTEELPQAMADAVQTAAADGFDTMSVALPKQAARVRAVSVTASASSAHEPQCRACSCNMVCNVSLDDEGEVVKQQCLAGLEDVQLVGSAPLPVELQ